MFLSAKEKEILDLVYKAKFSVEENTPLCLLGDKFFGFLKKKQKRIVICTQNAMKLGGYLMPRSSYRNQDDYDKTSVIIRKALRHEAVHVAQYCNNGKVLNPKKVQKINFHGNKLDSLNSSTLISANRLKEVEAYWMQDRPRKVISSLKKYCL